MSVFPTKSFYCHEIFYLLRIFNFLFLKKVWRNFNNPHNFEIKLLRNTSKQASWNSLQCATFHEYFYWNSHVQKLLTNERYKYSSELVWNKIFVKRITENTIINLVIQKEIRITMLFLANKFNNELWLSQIFCVEQDVSPM